MSIYVLFHTEDLITPQSNNVPNGDQFFLWISLTIECTFVVYFWRGLVRNIHEPAPPGWLRHRILYRN